MASLGAEARPERAVKFYTTVTTVMESYDKENVDLSLVTLPAGTVLFRGLKIPNASAGVDSRVFYRDFLGDPEGKTKVCMNSTHNVFFYPFPYVAFGAHDIGVTFDMMLMVVLVHPVNLICAISPSRAVRGTTKRYSGNAPFQRCDTLASRMVRCHPLTDAEKDALQWDNCLNPSYQVRSGTRGWMALAQLDSLNKKVDAAAASPMASYIRGLETRHPGAGAELAAWSYTDHNRNHGFPEIALYPYKVHQGEKPIVRRCASTEEAIRLMQKEAESDNLNYLPIAAFTKDGAVDMINGFFTQETLGVAANSFSTPILQKQQAIENKLEEYMDTLQTTGIKLPIYGPGKLCLDSRTGFYILPQVVPRTLKVQGAAAESETPYRFLALPLDTPEAKQRATNYILMFRTFAPQRFLDKYGLDKGFGVKRAMIFDRPPVLTRLFQELGIDIPAPYKSGLARASALFQKEKASVPLAAAKPLSIKAPVVNQGTPEGSPAYAAVTPQGTPPQQSQKASGFKKAKEDFLSGKVTRANIIGGYGKPTNPYALTEEELEEIVKVKTPGSPAYIPGSPATGGSRKAKKTKASVTRKVKSHKKTIYDIAKRFHSVWASLTK